MFYTLVYRNPILLIASTIAITIALTIFFLLFMIYVIVWKHNHYLHSGTVQTSRVTVTRCWQARPCRPIQISPQLNLIYAFICRPRKFFLSKVTLLLLGS